MDLVHWHARMSSTQATCSDFFRKSGNNQNHILPAASGPNLRSSYDPRRTAAEWFTPFDNKAYGGKGSHVVAYVDHGLSLVDWPSSGTSCPICLEPMENATSTPCGHVGCASVSSPALLFGRTARLIRLFSVFVRPFGRSPPVLFVA